MRERDLLAKFKSGSTWACLGIVIVTGITHGSVLFTDRFGVDTDSIMEGVHSFDKVGRQGLVWLAKLLSLSWFNLYYAQCLTIFFLCLAPIGMGYLFFRTKVTERGNGPALLVLGTAFVASPFWTTQIYFLNQSAQVTCSCFLIALSVLATEKACENRKKYWLGFGVSFLLMQIIFSCYQILTVMYAVVVATVFVLQGLKKERTVKEQIQNLLLHIGVFAAGFIGYLVIARLFFMEMGDYLEGLLKWGTKENGLILRDCLAEIGSSLRKNPPFYTGLYGVFSLLLFGVTILYFRLPEKRRDSAQGGEDEAAAGGKVQEGQDSAQNGGDEDAAGGKIQEGQDSAQNGEQYGFCQLLLLLAAELFLVLSPYVFVFFYGGRLLDRMQLILPLAQGCILYLTVRMLTEIQEFYAGNPAKKRREYAVKMAMAVLGILVFRDATTQMSYSNRLYYTDEQRFEQDYQLAHDLSCELAKLKASGQYKEDVFEKLVFVGYPQRNYNKTCLGADTIGYSHFRFNVAVRPDCLKRDKAEYFMRLVGYPLEPEPSFTWEETENYQRYFEEVFGETIDEMPVFPAEGSIRLLTKKKKGLKFLVVKLGEEWRFSDAAGTGD